MSAKQIKTIGANEIFFAQTTLSSKEEYMCANSSITKGLESPPNTLKECFNRFSNIKEYATYLGVTSDTLWFSPENKNFVPVSDPNTGNNFKMMDLLSGVTSSECDKVNEILGADWMGCLFGSPMSSFSCICPDIGSNYDAYLKFRLTVASFWETDVKTPVYRADFLDSIKYSKKLNIIIAGDRSIKPGDIVKLNISNLSSYSSLAEESILNNTYYVISVKNTFTNSGVHETALNLINFLNSGELFDNIE